MMRDEAFEMGITIYSSMYVILFFFILNLATIDICGFLVPSYSCLPYIELVSATR